MPPGTWYSRVLASTPSTLWLIMPLSTYFWRMVAKWARILSSCFKSRPVSYSVPCRAATIDSVGAWEVPSASGDIAVSMMSTPASIALSSAMEARPEV